MSLVSVSGGVHGNVSLDMDRNVVFTPSAEFSGEASFTYEITDGTNTATGTATITIAAMNDTPIVANEIADQNGTEDIPFNFTIPEDTFSDVDSSELTLSASLADGTELPEWLGFDPATRTFTGNPPENLNGALPVLVSASDGEASVSTSFAFNLDPVNDAPIAGAAIEDMTIEAGKPANITLPVDAFVDVDGNTLLYSAIFADGSDLPEWLSIDPFSGELSGTPPTGTDEIYSITITASDGSEEATSSLNLTIDPGNQTPVVDNPIANQASVEDTAVSFTIPADTFSDPDGDALSITALLADGSPLPDWLVFDGETSAFSGTPPQDFNGILDVTVTASDGELEASDNFALEITPVNDAPVVSNAFADQSSAEDEVVSFTLPSNAFSDVDGDNLTLTATLVGDAALPAWLVFDADARAFSGTPPRDFNGALDVTITASDGELEVSDTFTLEITPVNDAPIVATLLADQSSVEDATVSFTLPEDVFSDVDNDDLTLSAGLSSGAALPTWLSFDASARKFSGTPPQDFNGTLDVIVTASDGEFEVSDTFSLEITPVNDAPVVANVLADQSSNEDMAVSFALPADAFSDVDGDVLTLSATLADGSVLPSWLSFDADTRTFSGTPPQDFNTDASGALLVRVAASDGEFSASDDFGLEIIAVNDAPIAEDDGIFNTLEDTGLTLLEGDLLANDFDPDGDELSITSTEQAANGNVSLTPDGDIIYTPNAGFVGQDSFVFTVTDGEDSDTATVTINVTENDTIPDGAIVGTDGSDFIIGEQRDENDIYGEGGNDFIIGGRRADNINGGAGHDIVFGGRGADTINGDAGNDFLFGGRGADDIDGGVGNDIIFGGRGRDLITGSEGNDYLLGGRGRDLFVFKEGNGRDVIGDFSTGYARRHYFVAGDEIAIDIDGIDSFENLLGFASQDGRHTVFDFGDGDELILANTRLAALDQDAFTFF